MKHHDYKSYNKALLKTHPVHVEKAKKLVIKGRGYTVDRFVLRLKMLELGVENFNELGRLMGLKETNLANLRALVAGIKWRPGIARKVEEFLGVEPGTIFWRDSRTNKSKKEIKK